MKKSRSRREELEEELLDAKRQYQDAEDAMYEAESLIDEIRDELDELVDEPDEEDKLNSFLDSKDPLQLSVL